MHSDVKEASSIPHEEIKIEQTAIQTNNEIHQTSTENPESTPPKKMIIIKTKSPDQT